MLHTLIRVITIISLVAVPVILAHAQQSPTPNEQEVINDYIRALEAQLAFKNKQSALYEGKIRDWMEYSKPLWTPPAPTAEAK